MKEKILNLTKQLIIIESVSDDIEKLNKIITFVENYIKENTNTKNFFIEKFEFNKKPTLIVKNFDWKEADIILNWHLDVVKPYNPWQYNPYETDWKLYGRWAWDMKSWCAIIIELMIELLNLWFNKKKVILVLNTDEEVWWFNWAKEIINNWYTWETVIIPDWWSLKKIVFKEKWVFVFWFEINWKASHAARPWLWDNAIEKSYSFYNELKSYLEKHKIVYSDENKWLESVSITRINSGDWDNIIPNKANWTINIRFTETHTVNELKEYISDLIKKYNWKMLFWDWWEVMYTPVDNKIIQRYYEICKKDSDLTPELWIEHWASDGRFFSEKGSVVIIHRPTCKNIHWKDEYVIIDDFEKIYNIYKEFILTY